MVLWFDISREAKNALDALMARGQFKDVSEAVSTALTSYEVFSKTVSTNASASTAALQELRVETVARGTANGTPTLFRLERSPATQRKFSEVPDSKGQDVSPNGWLFGQYNKLLPSKVSCRGLLNLAHQFPHGVPLEEAAGRISIEAAVLGDYLVQLDRDGSRVREDAFAAAFPSTPSSDAGGRLRFANQFVGDLRQPARVGSSRESKFSGLLSALKLAICRVEKPALIELTQPGSDFAALENPVLDSTLKVPAEKLSDGEIKFLLSHLLRKVPEEVSAYTSIIDGIEDSANTPSLLDGYLCGRFGLEVKDVAVTANEITKTFLTTQRTGAISRMADLGLIGRKKSGLYVHYFVTQSGKLFRQTLK